MATNRLDLLPSERRRALRRAYLFRLGTVAAILALVLTLAACALLVPTYMYLRSAERSQNARLAGVGSTLSSAQESTLAKRLATLEADAAVITALGATPSASERIRATLAAGHLGVALTSMNYTAASARPGSLALSGTAASRNDLRALQLALLEVVGFASADLPVSSYAKDHDIPFTIVVTLATSTSP